MSEDFDTPPAPITIGANAPEISVSELSQALKRTVEDHFGRVRVRGEISNYRGPHSSGHAYFSLKDENARIDAVIWKGVMLKLRTRPQEGLEVLATGRITTFPGKSSYQIIIEILEPAGVGALMALLDARRRQLAAEGLFDESRKQPLPFLPKQSASSPHPQAPSSAIFFIGLPIVFHGAFLCGRSGFKAKRQQRK